MRAVAGNVVLIGLALATLALGVSAVLAPVKADDPVVHWPRAGQAPENTVLPLAANRPLSLDASVPCATLRSLDPSGGTALRTQPERDLSAQQRRDTEHDVAQRVGEGMRVAMTDGRVTVAASGAVLVDEPLPAGTCVYRVVADETGITVLRDGTRIGGQRGLRPPEVSELFTAAQGTRATGLAVELRPDARYQSVPSPLKISLLIAHALLLAVLLVLVWRRWSGRRPARPTRTRWSWADVVATVVTGAWVVLGPMQMDDSWYLLMSRNADAGGFMGNYIYMDNSTENPFVLSQYLLQAWGELGDWSLWWVRTVPAACGLATWFLLRMTLTRVLGRAGRFRVVPWALLVAHLLWFLPYGVSLRPEPVIVVLGAATLLLAELARTRESVGVLAAATACAALALVVSPSGAVAAAPLVLALPWLGRWFRRRPWSARIAAVSAAAAATTVVVPVGFADASLGEVLSSIATNNDYYFSFPWYEELVHYQTLLDTSGWARRLPVVLTLALIVLAAIGSGRGGLGRDPVQRLVLTSAIMSAIALGLIALSPTKWVNHFHAIAPVSTLLIAGALVRSPLPRRAGPVIRCVAVLLTVTAVSLAFAGLNNWVPYSDFGQLFGDHTDLNSETNRQQPHLGPVMLRNPLPWLGVAVVAIVWAGFRRRAGRLSRVDGHRAVLMTASLGSVVLLLASFVWAPISQGASWTVARSGLQTLFGDGCGLADDVMVARPSAHQLGTPTTPARLDGDFRGSRPAPLRTQPWERSTRVWHDDRPDGTSPGTGTLVTGWYPVPAHGGTHVTIPVAGALEGQVVEAEFGTGEHGTPRVTETRRLHGDPRLSSAWQQLSVALPEDRPDLVRFVVSDVVTGADSWLAAAEPKLTEFRPVTEMLGNETVFADQISAALWPCVRQARIENGITETPSVYLAADEAIIPGILNNPVFREWGGAWTQTAHAWDRTKITSELRPTPPPRLPWGQVFEVRYPYPAGRYDLHVHRTERGGLTQLPR
ncbi:arabinosyltransferase domain-containing protein [Saccharomonospora saliphila]|uniref:arabinosyltransferase domain-containing protein n=1 Tax=Saccharomonospora saliphila TaxID=369829 RepID=UPI00036972B6|nr:arabinosyltransferase domain-containing protein [Saccharomonospora saliphila]